MTRTHALLALAVACLGATAAPAQQRRQDLKATAKTVADDVRTIAKAQKVRFGAFSPVGEAFDRGDGRAAVEFALKTALTDILDPKSPLEVNGKFAYTEVVPGEGHVVVIAANLQDTKTLKVLKEIVSTVQYVGEIPSLVGASVNVAGFKDSKSARAAIAAAVQNPTAHAAGTLIGRGKDSPYQVEIRVKPNGAKGDGTPRAAGVEGGLPFVDIRANEAYEVRVLNNAPDEAAFRLSIDGLDQFVFTENRNAKGDPAFGYYILPAATNGTPGETVIRGWHKKFHADQKKHEYFEFLTTEFGKSGIAGKPENEVGMIHLAFFRTELFDPKSGVQDRGIDVETKKGQVGETAGDVVARKIRESSDFLTVRYSRKSGKK